ncbi:hypothetical protein F5Y08DRAFT_324808 [Xylaria arbuscula]|nr:hypothetical protein F5Y08DRAFT_324808 [Xylaria arbuscula]
MDSCGEGDWGSVTITNQDDIDNGPLAECATFYGDINIRNATGTLNFTGQAQVFNISVIDCPGLQTLSFPDTYTTTILQISEANSLTAVSLPLPSTSSIEFTAGGAIVSEFITSIIIEGATSLGSFDVGNNTYFEKLVLLKIDHDRPDTQWFNSKNLIAVSYIEIDDNCIDLSSLVDVGDLIVSGSTECYYPFESLKSIGNYVLTNISYPNALAALLNGRGAGFADPSPFQVNKSMVIDSLILPAIEIDGNFRYDSGGIVPQVTTVGMDFNITSNANLNLSFDALTDVGTSLFIHNNTNSQLKFDTIANVGSILILDNTNTTIPWFPALTIANDIHLRGTVDTSIGPNIFPALQSVTGRVTVEAWNDDFDCSKLVQYQNDHTIHNLTCSGKNNGTTNDMNNQTTDGSRNGTDTSQDGSNSALSQGQWAGIGIAIGVVVIGLVGALIWLYFHFKRQLKSLKQTGAPTGRGEVTGDRAELSHVHEVDGGNNPREKPDEPLVELPDQSTELPADPEIAERVVELESRN